MSGNYKEIFISRLEILQVTVNIDKDVSTNAGFFSEMIHNNGQQRKKGRVSEMTMNPAAAG